MLGDAGPRLVPPLVSPAYAPADGRGRNHLRDVGLGHRLAEARRGDDRAVAGDERTVGGLVVDGLAEAEDDERVDDAGEHRVRTSSMRSPAPS